MGIDGAPLHRPGQCVRTWVGHFGISQTGPSLNWSLPTRLGAIAGCRRNGLHRDISVEPFCDVCSDAIRELVHQTDRVSYCTWLKQAQMNRWLRELPPNLPRVLARVSAEDQVPCVPTPQSAAPTVNEVCQLCALIGNDRLTEPLSHVWFGEGLVVGE